MKYRIYQVDAFTNNVFSGNPAAVCPLEKWLSDQTLQNIAAENNLAETAFYVKKENHYEIRWFTPTVEVNLCGHASLATAFVLFNFEGHTSNEIYFHSNFSGKLNVLRNDDTLTLNFPTDQSSEIVLSEEIKRCFSIRPLVARKGEKDYLVLFKKEKEIKDCRPNLEMIIQLGGRGIIISAPGEEVDFVSRYFAPQLGINEDPVTGSAHTTLIPYWANKLKKQELNALQLSKRGGELNCTYLGDRVAISGQAKLYMKGEIYL